MYYTVEAVATSCHVNNETVRRWIRDGKLEAEKKSKKEGYIVTDKSFEEFIQQHPKYNFKIINTPRIVQIKREITKLTIRLDQLNRELKNLEES